MFENFDEFDWSSYYEQVDRAYDKWAREYLAWWETLT